ncbi:uncharacterized protein [Argopecten irradians]|uniref:uncharacterized protein n=1 Tax=Argopecten irradians TaxID=31199 RepID=UPI0037151111
MERNRTNENANFCRLVMYMSSCGCEILEQVILNVIFNELLADKRKSLEKPDRKQKIPFERLYPAAGPLPRYYEFEDSVIEEIFPLKQQNIILPKYLRTTGLYILLTKYRNTLLKFHKKIGENAWNKIDTLQQKIKIKELDVTIFAFIYRNVSKHSRKDWNTMPLQEEVAIEDDVCRIILHRNTLSHYRKTRPISDEDFEKMWNELTQAFKRLCKDQQKLERESIRKKTEPIDETLQSEYEQMISSWTEEESENVEKLKLHISVSQDDTICRLSGVVRKGNAENRRQIRAAKKDLIRITQGCVGEAIKLLKEQRLDILEDSKDALQEQLDKTAAKAKSELGDIVVCSMKQVGNEIEKRLSDVVKTEMATLADPIDHFKQEAGTVITDCLNKTLQDVEVKVADIVKDQTVGIIEHLMAKLLDELITYILSTAKSQLLEASQSEILEEIIMKVTDTIVEKLAEENKKLFDTAFQQSVPRHGPPPDGNTEPGKSTVKPTDLMTIQVQTWVADVQDFFNTSAYREVVSVLESDKCVTVVGPPLSGKTSVARKAALHMRSKGYAVFPVSGPKEMEQFMCKGVKPIFVIDDPLGKNLVDEEKLKEWRDFDDRLRKFIEKVDVKILWIMNKEQLNEKHFKTARLILAESTVDITSQELSCDEKKGILMKHLETTFLEDEHSYANIMDIAGGCNFFFFPKICKQFKHISKWQRALENPFMFPFEVLVDYFDHLPSSSKHQFCALCLCALHGKLPSHQPSLNHFVTSEIRTFFFGIDNPSVGKIISSLNAMVGTWIRQSGEHFEFSHESYQDTMLFLMGEHDQSVMIRNMSSRCIHERVRYDPERPVETSDRYACVLREQYIKELSLRLCLDVMEQDVRSLQQDNFEQGVLKLLKTALEEEKLDEINSLAILALSIRTENEEMLDTLVRNKPEIFKSHFTSASDYVDKEIIGFTSLHFAVWRSSAWGVERLLQCREADVNILSKESLTPLFLAVEAEDQEKVSKLIKAGADVNIPTEEGLSPIHIAIERNNVEITERLVRGGADMKKLSPSGLTPLHLAIEQRNVKMLEKLIEVDVDTNLRDANRKPPLVFALEQDESDMAIIKKLISHSKTDLNPSGGCDNPLHLAVRNDHFEVVTSLLSCARLDVNVTDDAGSTALHVATRKNASNIATQLLRKADLSMKDKKGNTPLDIAEKKNYTELAEFFRRYMALN